MVDRTFNLTTTYLALLSSSILGCKLVISSSTCDNNRSPISFNIALTIIQNFSLANFCPPGICGAVSCTKLHSSSIKLFWNVSW